MWGGDRERLILNENSVWSGAFQDRINNNSFDAFPKIRDHLENGQLSEANNLVLEDMAGSPTSSRSYSVTNDLYLDFGHSEDNWSNFTRWLDIAEGVSGLSYDYEGVTYT